MITNNSLTTRSDSDKERRRALAKVYDLLLRLADEAENKKVSDRTKANEKEETAALKNDASV